MARIRDRLSAMSLSFGATVIMAIAVCSSVAVALRLQESATESVMWTYARTHILDYVPIADRWNEDHPDRPSMTLHLIGPDALERRTLSGFLSNTPVADLIEIERRMSGRFFVGPLESVGFVDLTDRLHSEGIYDRINEPSFGPWTSRGRIFGLPHDVHPVLLGYRADLIEQAGIDVTRIETWDDFRRILGPLIEDLDGDGRADRYLLNVWHTNKDIMEVLLLQAGGSFFDADGRPCIDSAINARVLATIVSWIAGPDRIAIDAPEFTASGNQLRLQGQVLCSLMPDWLCGVWRNDLPGLAGKIKLMPLPAWEPGGRRTSVWGGTMLGIARSTPHDAEAWAFARHLYLSPELAESAYRTVGIISPVKDFWSQPFYDEPDPFFCGQAPGRRYVEAAPDVPRRTSSPFNELAKDQLGVVVSRLRHHAIARQIFDPEQLIPPARALLAESEALVRRRMARNVFHRDNAQ